MVLMKGVQIGTLYKLLGSVDLSRCNNIIVPEVDSTSTRLNSNLLEGLTKYYLVVGGRLIEKYKIKLFSRKSKSKGRSKSLV
jgi:hypothetical protein